MTFCTLAPFGRPTCYRCLRPEVSCICDLVTAVANRTEVVVVQHPREQRHPFGTVRIARLALERVQVRVAARNESTRAACPPLANPEHAALLFPCAEAVPIALCDPAPKQLVVVDGTWPCARKLVRDNPWLQQLRRVSILPPRPGRYRIRAAPDPSVQLSTIEAIAFALIELEPDTVGVRGLLDTFDKMIDHQIELAAKRGLDPDSSSPSRRRTPPPLPHVG